MAAATTSERLPSIARLGFDHGWLILSPTFLNLGAPTLLLDAALVGDGLSLGLETFGTRDPRQPLPITQLRIDVTGRFVGVWDTRPADPELITIGTIASPSTLELLLQARSLVLFVGDTGAAERSWSELWHCAVGVAFVERAR